MQIFSRGHSVSQNGGAPFLRGLHHKLSIISSASFAFTLSSITALDLPCRLCLVSQPRSFTVPSETFPVARPESRVRIAALHSLCLCLGPSRKYPSPLLHMALPYPLPLLAINSLEHPGTRTTDRVEDKVIVPFPTILMRTTLSPAACRKAACSGKPARYEQG